MNLATATADLRARFLRELNRLDARAIHGGPYLAIRDGVLLAWMPKETRVAEVDDALFAKLAALPDQAGVDAVAGALAS